MQAFNSKVINILFLSGFFVVIVGSFARYYFLKEFPVNIEVSCDPSLELCFQRDCEKDECPPNGLSTYRQFELAGHTFAACDTVDGCESFCKNNSGECIETVCGETDGDICIQMKEQGIADDISTTTEAVK
jgi:hypothetical protein